MGRRQGGARRDFDRPFAVNMTETIIHLKPQGAWRAGQTRERMSRRLTIIYVCPA